MKITLDSQEIKIDTSQFEPKEFNDIAFKTISIIHAKGKEAWTRGIGGGGNPISREGYQDSTKDYRAARGRQAAFVDLILSGTLFGSTRPNRLPDGASVIVQPSPHPNFRSGNTLNLFNTLADQGFNMPFTAFSPDDEKRIDKAFTTALNKKLDEAVTIQ